MQLNSYHNSSSPKPSAYSWDVSYKTLKSHFNSFCLCIDPNSLGGQLSSLTSVRSSTDDSIEIAFAGVRLRFTMFHVCKNAGNPHAEIYVTKESHNLSDETVAIGKFTLKVDGKTDLLMSSNTNDFAKIDVDAGAIISEYIYIALNQPVTV